MRSFLQDGCRFGALMLGFLLLPGCERGGEGETDQAAVRTFPVRGVVQKRMDDPAMMLIDHEEIPGFMPRMVMPFRVLDAAEFDGIAPGMVVTLNYHVAESESWATDVVATGERGELTLRQETPSAKRLGVGDVLPDHGFVDEDGKPLRLSDCRGSVVALTFVFSRCPVPEYCPRMMTHFAEVRKRLDADPAAPAGYRLLTISFDSGYDTPEVMKAWGARYGHGPGQSWSLLSTPDEAEIASMAAQVGLKYGEANGTLQHNLRTVVLDGEGTIRALFTDETWSVDELVAAIKEAGRSKPETK